MTCRRSELCKARDVDLMLVTQQPMPPWSKRSQQPFIGLEGQAWDVSVLAVKEGSG